MFKSTNKKYRFTILKILIPLFLLFILAIPTYYYVNYSYGNLINDFYSEFNKSNFDIAQSIVTENNLVLSLKKKDLNNDLNTYFTSIVDKLCTDIKNGKIMPSKAVSVFKEMKDYDVMDTSLDELILSIDETYVPEDGSSSQSILALAIELYNKKNYAQAIDLLSKIPSTELEAYATAKGYINKCKTDYKSYLFDNADELIANKYYTKALELLNDVDTTIITNEDEDVQKKINSVESAKAEYLAFGYEDDAEYTSTAILQSITMDNINTLNIESKTEFFIYVNLDEQKTYIYRGRVNDWNLYKSFYCSTGIAGEETPKGIYAISGRGDWFYSDDYDQGGKYWVRFMGDYLFHSLPFDESATNVVDDTLGRAASHGCIRLNIEDAKWIYDNVEDNTKVIIN